MLPTTGRPALPRDTGNVANELELTIARKERVADDVVRLVLRPPGGTAVPRWSAGAHIDVVVPGFGARQYSLCGDVRDQRSLTICVLREPAGRGASQHIHDNLSEGDPLTVHGPRNHFPLVPASRYLFLAGGIGITPILPMIRQATESGADWQLHYGGRRRSSMAFAAVLRQRFPDRVNLYPQDEVGLLDVPGLLTEPDDHSQVYCCGPEGLLKAAETHCAAWSAPRLHVERFTANTHALAGPRGTFEVELSRSGLTVTVPADRSIMEVVEDAGITVPYSCREGICGTCETRVLAGIPDHRDAILTDNDHAANQTMMICCSRSSSPRLLLDL